MLGLNFLLVQQANRVSARRAINEDLQAGGVLFDQLIGARLDKLTLGVRLMSADWAFRQLFGATTDFNDAIQRATLLSGLQNYLHRMPAASFLKLVSLEDELLADTSHPELAALAPFHPAALLRAAEHSESYSAHAFALLEGRPVLLLAAPIELPEPMGWIVAGFSIDAALADEFKRMAAVDVSFVEGGATPRILATTLPAAQVEELTARLAEQDDWTEVRLVGVPWIGSARTLPGGDAIRCLIQRNLESELAPHRRLERLLLLLTFAALLVSAGVAVRLAAGISRPVSELARGVARIGQGNYREPVAVRSQDELGQLAGAFNRMAAGLEERDRVRDLLGKAVSPEIAAELLRRPLALGGEERIVTVLFTDIRGFTSYSERVPPTELVAVLNDYFTRVTRVIEAHGGIVDKYIGDAVMAVFGAPLERPDHAARALACARELLRAIDALNRERDARGAWPLHTGIGIATGRVVAGNLGSESRHNYTVMGDAANLAARLQDLTKEHGVPCLIAAETAAAAGAMEQLRSIGEVPVRGKAEPIQVYALVEL
ncbi:MAG TPA: adenylate/guanylate cyclase domain-containing protein [Kiritimatiellia bacterium]|nr:adenylate/guanylate cyclase domain-containing protein [Kiritimatiellia bacterium]